MGDTLEFSDIYQEVKGSWNDGRLRFGRQSVVYKSSKTGKVDSIPAAELSQAQWRRVCLGQGIKLTTSTGHIYKYDGFRDTVTRGMGGRERGGRRVEERCGEERGGGEENRREGGEGG
ncbi:unnamed protein product [Oncorhynchus mykiss]|uniref:FACT complex subunit SSRP1/POB3 N-terminal PH domain-containing protein n=1 Tax=Oncorhynchus mykiss TaxID=8022 RepID=A0A060VV78_ONCMY|nr:unnamed protein product [Oncorhynchus mykiss]